MICQETRKEHAWKVYKTYTLYICMENKKEDIKDIHMNIYDAK